MSKLEDLTGQKFNRLTVQSINLVRKGKEKKVQWNCVCDCGNKHIVPANELKSGHTKSCGCFHTEVRKKLSGNRHYNWQGGYNIEGSIAWAKKVLSVAKTTSKISNITPPLDSYDVKDVLELWNRANGKCRICNNPEKTKNKRLSLDHYHETGELRGFLCSSCNKGLGCFMDSVEILEEAIRYIKSSKEVISYCYN